MILILPVENQVRELDAKLLLACVAAERGLPVIIGSGDYVDFQMPHLPHGLFLAMSMRSVSARMLRIIHGLSHRIVACDEEGLVRYDSPEYYAWRYSADTFKVVEQLFAWGPDDAEFLARYPDNAGITVHVTGNPRTDLLRHEMRGYFAAEADALRSRYGEFILVNTNFAFVSNFVPELNLVLKDAHGHPRVSRSGRGMSLPFAVGMAAHQQSIFDHFRALVPTLAARFPGHRIIVRPHPSENHDVWRQALKGSARVEVIHRGNVVPWLMAARALLHNGCTTAVEASLLGTPAVAFMPVMSEVYDYHLPNGLSHRARTAEEVCQMLGEILAGRRGLSDLVARYQLLNRHLMAEHASLACDRIVSVLLENARQFPAPPPVTLPRLLARLECHVRTAEKGIKRLIPGRRNSSAYHSHRFPDLTASDVNDRISRFGALLGRFDGVRAEHHSRHVFRIQGSRAVTGLTV